MILCFGELKDLVKQLDNDEILKNTFRPQGPSAKYGWLSTSNIDEVISQYEDIYKDFVFLGALPNDFEELPLLGLSNINFNDLSSIFISLFLFFKI
mgnify:CR=1 FL=1